MNKQRKIIIKPLHIKNNNMIINNQKNPNGKKSEVQDFKNQAPKSSTNLDENFSYEDDDDVSSVSSIESDCSEMDIWDNSELRLRGINTQDFTDFYGKKLSFVQLYMIRSSFYTKGYIPQINEVFHDVENIHTFFQKELNLDEFLEEEERQNLIKIDYTKDKNFSRFAHFFEQNRELNSKKMREEQYDRYNRVQLQDCNILNSESPDIQNRNSTCLRSGKHIINDLKLSPRKPLQNKKQDMATQGQNGEDLRKNKLTLVQLQEIQRKQKIQMSQQRLKQLFLQQESKIQFDQQKQSLSQIEDVEEYDNQSSTQVSNNSLCNSNTFNSSESLQKSENKNPTKLINLKIATETSQLSPTLSPKNYGSTKRRSPIGQLSPISEQNEFRFNLKNPHQNDHIQINSIKNNPLNQISQSSLYSSMVPRKDQQNVQGISSFTKFLSSCSSPKQRTVVNSMNFPPIMSQSVKQSQDFKGLANNQQQLNNSLLNSTQFKSLNQNNNQQQYCPLEQQQFNGKNNNNTKIKLPSISNLQEEKKSSIKPQLESPLPHSQRFIQSKESTSSQSSSSSLSSTQPKQQQALYYQSNMMHHSTVVQKQSSYQRCQINSQSTSIGDEQIKYFLQLLQSKQRN